MTTYTVYGQRVYRRIEGQYHEQLVVKCESASAAAVIAEHLNATSGVTA